MFLIKLKTEKKGEQLLLLRQTKDLSLILATLLQFKEEKKKKREQKNKAQYGAMEPLDQRVTGRSGDSTVVLPVLGHEDVAIISPLFTPAVGAQDTGSVFCHSSCKATSLSYHWLLFGFHASTHLFFTIQYFLCALSPSAGRTP